MKNLLSQPIATRIAALISLLAAGILLGGWVYFTPDGLLGKMDAIAYAVCHRIPARSFFMDNTQLPLCARCTGMYLGAFITQLFQVSRGKRGSLPSRKMLVFLGFLAVLFGIDGFNSYLHLIPNAPSLYEPANWSRLATGSGMGVGLAAVLYPIFNQSVWRDWVPERTLNGWKQLLLLTAAIVAMNFLVLSELPFLLYPVALLSALTVMAILTMVYTIVWLMVTKKENTYLALNKLGLPFVAGLATALAQIALMDGLRFMWTGTWQGFQL
jgi:uncharacterized membrane protein